MKTIEQLLELKDNPYYDFTPEEKAVLDTFLYKRQAQQAHRKGKSDKSGVVTLATVLNKNQLMKETGEIEEMENIVHPDAVN